MKIKIKLIIGRNTISKFVLVLSLFILSNYSFGEQILPPTELINEALSHGNYLGVITLLRSHEQTYLGSQFHQLYFDLLATYESFLGMYQEALQDDDIAYDPMQSSKAMMEMEKHELRSAKETIITASETHQVIFINEAHHTPQNRAFSLTLLQGLYDHGFRYFAAETLYESDTQLNSRGYPLSRNTGYYTDEPLYGELVRAAQKIGYTIIPYEYGPNCNPSQEPPEKCQNLREEGQAKNLYERVFKIDPTAKLFVHAGYGHISKKGAGGWIPMAVYFEQITGISPFSIDQTNMREHSSSKYENRIYRDIANTGLLDEASVLVTENNTLWLPPDYQERFDLMVFHPRTRYQDNRPAWLLESEKRKIDPISVTICQSIYPCVVEAYIENEGPKSMPLDRIVITSSEIQPTLALLPGKYIIQALDQFGNILSSNTYSFSG